MSEKNGPFDNVVEVLRHSAFSITDAEAEAAIHVLEAAGKIVDRRNEVLECLNAITPSNDGRVNYIYNSVRGLLESLPDKEQK
jgi:hypothetical protein